MNTFLFRLTSLVTGLLFGLGMVISGMADPTKVIGFLDVAGAWDPSLMFVMGGALLVFMPAYFIVIKPKAKPLNASSFSLANNPHLDSRLISGAVIFGLGWGLAGICPGPAVSSLALGNRDVWVFFVAMLVGLFVMGQWLKTKN
ncbi:YeeE/YedE family protein [Vibrio sp. V31_P5A7T61]|uniref:YeeE/YedE family protein n=1 Tax=unclassified Vibrio TaxID=2614977 RepID=UPI001372E345|nr:MULTISPECIES: YeeE/YedE family protein [unclassified Vibrio]EKO3659361.1 YeeE/YedE family protein [Vibrio metschnikovii]NAW60380.1 YeeE/YedE family protein [Vibrio sp. V31_P5A7T61]NAX01201.1 YeeE/YedE family protein [Vibrio sp. V34_P3A8T189]NAX09788.1 YeeE/YedE family protein [Vibrio sp. V40_P2S30T141]NAX64385.1 YeeE/YedE family protein [Vibrio sp. V32_P6A28T40]